MTTTTESKPMISIEVSEDFAMLNVSVKLSFDDDIDDERTRTLYSAALPVNAKPGVALEWQRERAQRVLIAGAIDYLREWNEHRAAARDEINDETEVVLIDEDGDEWAVESFASMKAATEELD